jgi:hypothetical protein
MYMHMCVYRSGGRHHSYPPALYPMGHQSCGSLIRLAAYQGSSLSRMPSHSLVLLYLYPPRLSPPLHTYACLWIYYILTAAACTHHTDFIQDAWIIPRNGNPQAFNMAFWLYLLHRSTVAVDHVRCPVLPRTCRWTPAPPPPPWTTVYIYMHVYVYMCIYTYR